MTSASITGARERAGGGPIHTGIHAHPGAAALARPPSAAGPRPAAGPMAAVAGSRRSGAAAAHGGAPVGGRGGLPAPVMCRRDRSTPAKIYAFLGFLIPGGVRAFPTAEAAKAREWIVENQQ